MKVLHLIRSAWGGGLERDALDLAEATVERGGSARIAYWHRTPPDAARVPYVKLPAGRNLPVWPLAAARLVRRERPDIVHVHGTAAGSVGAMASRLATRAPIVYTEGGTPAMEPAKTRWAQRVTARVPTATVAVSEAVAHAMLANTHAPSDRMHVIRPGVPDAPPLRPPDASSRPKLVTVGNLWPRKGHLVLIDALSKLEADLEVMVCGEGPARDELEHAAAVAGVSDRMRFLGYSSEPWSVAAGAWALVHPSLQEGLPRSVAEAMMRGLPVIVTDVDGTPEIVRDGDTGLVVPPDDALALADAMRRLLADRSLRDRLATSARAFALENLRICKRIDAYFDLYKRLLDER